MNYSPFLNKNLNKSNRFINNPHHHLFSKKKNSKIFLLTSFLMLMSIITLVTYIANEKTTISKQLTTSSPTLPVKLSTTLTLPEIAQDSIALPRTVPFVETVNSPSQTKKSSHNISQTSSDSETIQLDAKVKPAIIDKPVINLHHSIIESSTTEADNAQIEITVTENQIGHKKEAQILAHTNEKKPLTKQPIVTKIDQDSSLKETTVSVLQKKIPRKINKKQTILVKKGDTLSAIFKREALSISTLYKILNSGKQAKLLTKIKPGQKLIITTDEKKKLKSLHFTMNKVDTLIVNAVDNSFVSHIKSKETSTRQQFAMGIIENSLFTAGHKAGLSGSMIMKLAQIFAWDIDFALDIRKGDTFSVLYDEHYIDGKKINNGEILSAEFVNNGKVFKAIRYTDASDHTDYYSEKGLSMRKAFLRTPVAFSRISSRFSNGRKHPVLNKIRAHKGVDYAASRGTPIKAVGKGKVIFKGRKGGYGRVIILQHGVKYTTLYAHMNSYNKKLKNGSRVKQGQVIGYVGSSGMATGAHLHYEFRLNGVHRNPLTVPLPSASPIAKKYRADFQVAAENQISQLKLRKRETIALKSE